MSRLESEIAAHALAAEKVWGKAYGKFANVLASKKLYVGAEIGIAFGGHAESILKTTKIKLLYGIDPYRHIRGYDDPMNLPQKEFDALYKFVLNRMAPFKKRYAHIRSSSLEAVRKINGPLDFIYIDADHSYQGVWDDLLAWFPKVREGGIIGGHDYGHVNFPGVQQAIDEFFRRFGWRIHKEGEGVWWVEKRPLNISFIMPAYNAELTIQQSIESIFNGNLLIGDEVVVVDDRSTDGTYNISKNLSKTHPEIKVIRHPKNKGGGAARNTAVRATKNPLIFCLDSDNVLSKNSVPSLLEFLAHSGADIASFEVLKYFKGSVSNTTHEWHFKASEASLAGALSTYKFPGSSGNYLFTRESWERAGHYPELAGALDAWGLGFRQVATGSKMKVLVKSFYSHRYGHDSYWTRESQKGTISKKAFRIVSPFFDILDKDDVEYIKSNRSTWFDNLEKHPIGIKNESVMTSSTRKSLKQFIGSKLKRGSL